MLLLLTTPPAGKTVDGVSQSNEDDARFDATPRKLILSIMIERRDCDPDRVIERGMILGE